VGLLLHMCFRLSVCPFFHFFYCSHSHSHSLLSISALTWSVYCVCSLTVGLLPLIFISNNLLGILCSSFLSTCPDHLSLLSSFWFYIASILLFPLMYVFLILPLLLFPTIVFMKFSSAACSLLSSLVHSLISSAYNIILLRHSLNIAILHFLTTCLSHNKQTLSHVIQFWSFFQFFHLSHFWILPYFSITLPK
jgi:hypothetical protein